MSGSYAQVNVRCPFYRRDDGKLCVKCEGVDGESGLTLRFAQKSRWERYMGNYCCGDYETCPLYKAVEQKYTGRE